jgi:predicted nucleic acid-binding protein
LFANRYTAFIDACTLARVLPRNPLLSLAEADFFRIRWSTPVLDETERAISGMLHRRGNTLEAAQEKAAHQIQQMRAAFEDAEVVDFEHLLPTASDLPDPNDAHVLAAALKTQAAAIVTDNLKDFPANILGRLKIEARSSDDFIADTIALDTGRAVSTIRRLRERFKRPETTPEEFLLSLEAANLLATADSLRPHLDSL